MNCPLCDSKMIGSGTVLIYPKCNAPTANYPAALVARETMQNSAKLDGKSLATLISETVCKIIDQTSPNVCPSWKDVDILEASVEQACLEYTAALQADKERLLRLFDRARCGCFTLDCKTHGSYDPNDYKWVESLRTALIKAKGKS